MLQLKNVSKSYRTTDIETLAVADATFSIGKGEFVAIMGPSGCGKSTLLNILGLLDSPSHGSYRFLDKDVTNASDSELTALRRESIGFIFQGFNLIDDLNVAENVEVALIYRKVSAPVRRRMVNQVIERVGLAHRARHFPTQLSGGQQQRVAIARALAGEPMLILADEPTGNLDSSSGATVLELLSAAAKAGTSVVMVTHSLAHAAVASRTLNMLDGKLVSETQLGV